MSQGYKICPICGTTSHRNATLCSTCGTSLTDVPVVSETRKPSTDRPAYDRRYGETDLLESAPRRRSEVYLFGGLLVVLALVCVGAIGVIALRWVIPGSEPTATATQGTATSPALALATNTRPPAPVMATVTPPPPSATPTPTQGPCQHTVASGEDLISIAWGCGHRSLDVLPLILEMNDLDAPESLRVGDELLIPWPTETPDPNNPQPGGDGTDAADTSATEVSSLFLPGLEFASAPTQGSPTAAPTATLIPGVMWHTVQTNENVAVIAYQYQTTLETLSQLNPEVTFSQCDYGQPTGGESCTVLIYAGQQLRVPAPSPTPTLSPTLTGSETPTPTWTPTFNAPSAIGPANRSLFMRDEIVTLRWVASGALSDSDTYRVEVEDTTSGQVYTGDTTELFYLIPTAWQGADGKRHDYRWTVSVVNLNDPENPYFTTEPRLFTWEGR